MCDDLVVFYTAFELVLVPLFVLLGQFGGAGRFRASFLLFLYTLGGSLLMLVAFSLLVVGCGTSSITAMKTVTSGEMSDLVFVGLVVSLAVKTPLVPFHV